MFLGRNNTEKRFSPGYHAQFVSGPFFDGLHAGFEIINISHQQPVTLDQLLIHFDMMRHHCPVPVIILNPVVTKPQTIL